MGVFSERSGGFHRLQKNSIEGDVLKGHGFSRAAKYPIKTRALAPEGFFSPFSPEKPASFRSLFNPRINPANLSFKNQSTQSNQLVHKFRVGQYRIT
jgi:hypothetical protein